MTLRSKLPDIGTTIFTVMSQMAAEHNAINLSQGYPDFSVPEELLSRLAHYAAEGHNQYPPMQGVPYLREQIAAKFAGIYGLTADSETEITITSGATEALLVAFQSVVFTGDEVLVFDPAFDSYEPAIQLAGGIARHIALTGDDFHIDWVAVRDQVTARTKAVIINSPHNPTGAILSQDDLDELADIATSNDLYVISDEVYEHMVFDGRKHLTVAGHPGLRDRSFVISSFGKTYHATGWKVGYCIASPELTAEFRKIHQFVTFTTHTPTQWAIADFMEHHPEHHLGLSAFYQAKRDLLASILAQIGFRIIPSQGTYFQLADYQDLSIQPDTEFVTELTTKAGVAAIPISVFYERPPEATLVRFCFAKEDATLAEAAERLGRHFK